LASAWNQPAIRKLEHKRSIPEAAQGTLRFLRYPSYARRDGPCHGHPMLPA
jgi:hypothetical protein